MTLADAALREACRRGLFCSATAAEFAAPRAYRNLSSGHLYILMAHCLWCTDKEAGTLIPHLSHCLGHYTTHINTSGPLPPMPPFEEAASQSPVTSANLQNQSEGGGGQASDAVLACLLAMYALLIAVGLFSNLFIAVILLRRRANINITNLFVLALSLSDILICGMLMPALLLYDLTNRNYISLSLPHTFYCRFVLVSLNVPIYASCLIILWISIDRYRIICHPHKPRISHRQARWLLAATVLIGLLIHSPVIAFNNADTNRGNACKEKWPHKGLRLAYSIGAFCLQFCFPLLITGSLYFLIYRRLIARMRRRRDSERKSRTNRILIVIVCSFVFFWSPWSIFNVILEVEQFRARRDPEGVAAFFDCAHVNQSWDQINTSIGDVFNSDSEDQSIVQPSWNLYEMLVRLFALGSACVNPYLYGWLNEQVRASVKACIGRRSGNNAGASMAAAAAGTSIGAGCSLVPPGQLARASRHRNSCDTDRRQSEVPDACHDDANEDNGDNDLEVREIHKMLTRPKEPNPDSLVSSAV